MGHTPGPWVVREPDADERLADIAEGRSPEDMELTEVYADDGGQQVCYVMNDTPDEAANARLIAAAPDLLGFLHQIAEECKRRLRKGEDGGDRLTLQLCKAAISKAEGRSE